MKVISSIGKLFLVDVAAASEFYNLFMGAPLVVPIQRETPS